MRIALIFFLFFYSFLLFGQSGADKSMDLEDRYFYLYEKLTDFHYSNIDSAEYYSNKLIELSETNGDSIWMAAAYEGLGYVYFYRDQMEESLPYFEKQKDILLNHAEEFDVSQAYMNIGNAYSGMAMYDLGIQNYLIASSLLPEDDAYGIERAYLNYNLANTFLDFEDFRNAEKYLTIADKCTRDNELEDLYPSILNLWAELALRKEKAELAVAYADSSIKLSIANVDLTEELYALELKARGQLKLGIKTEAIDLQKESLKKAKIYGDPYMILLAYAWMSEIFLECDSLEQAVFYAERAYEMRHKQHSIVGKKRATEVYALILGSTRDYKKQAAVLKEYITYQDSLHRVNLNESILEAQNETFAENNALLMETSSLQKTVISRNKQIRLILIIALFLAFVVLAIIGLMVKRRNDTNAELLNNQALLDDKSQALEEVNQQLESLNQGKDKLLSILTHDIKQPFNQTLGVLELLDVYTEGNQELHTVLKQVKESVENDKKTVENLLIWSKSQFAKISAEPSEVDCNEVTFKVINELKISLQEKKIDLNLAISKESKLLADPYHVEIILRNLVINAVKFSHPGGKLDISSNRQDGMVEIAIRDEGIGMSENDLSKLFDQHRHFSENGTLNETGTGLGMLIVYDFVKENQGEIEVESTLEKGSIFRLKFPAA